MVKEPTSDSIKLALEGVLMASLIIREGEASSEHHMSSIFMILSQVSLTYMGGIEGEESFICT